MPVVDRGDDAPEIEGGANNCGGGGRCCGIDIEEELREPQEEQEERDVDESGHAVYDDGHVPVLGARGPIIGRSSGEHGSQAEGQAHEPAGVDPDDSLRLMSEGRRTKVREVEIITVDGTYEPLASGCAEVCARRDMICCE